MNFDAEEFFSPGVEFSPGPSDEEEISAPASSIPTWIVRVASTVLLAATVTLAGDGFSTRAPVFEAALPCPYDRDAGVGTSDSVGASEGQPATSGAENELDEDDPMAAAWMAQDEIVADLRDELAEARRSRGLVRPDRDPA